MIASAAVAIGGIGLFLIGMLILTDGLKSLIGNSQRRVMAQLTNSPATGALTGALMTAVVQSSSATTVTAVGFVGAGLLTFTQALGIIFGANIGTTLTGWIVAVLGFKLQLGAIALPVLLVAVLVKFFSKGRTALAGWSLAGFCLIFIGLNTMQEGMELFGSVVTPDDFPSDTFFGRLQLVGIGIAITLLTQSSSAGIAAAMVALASGTINLPQAAAMIIGMNVATTFTAVLAATGGSTAMRQTGFAHMIYNVLTGILAFSLLTPFASIAAHFTDPAAPGSDQLALAAFHTTFNTLGVLLILPVTGLFARLILWLIPDDGTDLSRRLDNRLLPDTAAATDALAGTLNECALILFDHLHGAIDRSHRRKSRLNLARIQDAISKSELYTADIQARRAPPAGIGRFTAAIHALDHLRRLCHRATQSQRIVTIAHDPALREVSAQFVTLLANITRSEDLKAAERDFDALRKGLREQRHRIREDAAYNAAAGLLSVDDTINRLDSIRWLHRSAYHVWRIAHHLSDISALEAADDVPTSTAELEAELD
ncbi:Na/Pi symporter [Nisaea sp.]|uniref:Na/Pi cotransporter family protein n=1 Tax=Nisaea sp. TaxID=2024842 RepID=UPI002B269B31|nr:Na/Pi symporter [Nisaea sp.]